MEEQLLLLIVLVASSGIAAQWLAWRVGVPAIFVLLILGFLLGPIGRVLSPEQDFGELLRPAVSIAVSIVVMEGGLNLNFAELRKAGQGVVRLVGFGVPLGWAAGAAAAHFIGGISWPTAVLLGAMLVITGPTVVQPLLRQAKLARRAAAFLKWESVLNDAIGAVLTVLVLEFLLAYSFWREVDTTLAETAVGLGLGLAVGGGLGVAAAFATRFLFNRRLAPEFLKAPMVLATALLIYAVAHAAQPESGLIAVAVFGIGLANMDLPEIEELRRFKEGLSVFLVSGLFIVITATLDTAVFERLGWRHAAFVLAVLILVRPATMAIATTASDMSWRERLFVALIAPRGIVVAALATFAATRLTSAGYPDADLILPLVFSVIIATVVLHGFVIGPLARGLGLASSPRPGVIIVGSNPWTVALARTLRGTGTPVLLNDHSAEALRLAHEAELTTHLGHVLAPSEEDPEELKDFEVLLAATDNDALNALICMRFAPDLGLQHVYQTGHVGGTVDDLALNREWRGRIAIAPHLTIAELRRRLEEGWRFVVEDVEAADDMNSAFRQDPDSRLPVILIEPSGELLFVSAEADVGARARGRLVVFVKPEEGAPQVSDGRRRRRR